MRPRKSSASTSNGITASSTGTADGARTGLVKVILVSGDWEDMALYLGSRGARQKGSASSELSRGQSGLIPPFVESPQSGEEGESRSGRLSSIQFRFHSPFRRRPRHQ